MDLMMPFLKRHWMVLAVVVPTATIALLAQIEPAPRRLDLPLPAFSLSTLDGKMLGPEAFRSGPWIVALWMPGCGACTKDLTAFEKARREFEPRGVHFLAVSVSDDPALVRQTAADLGLGGAQAMTNGDVLGAFGLTGVPSALFINRSGRIVGKVPYGLNSSRFFADRARDLLKG